MLDAPKTLEEARAYKYGRWAGKPEGRDYVEYHCIREVQSPDGWGHYQCSRKNGHGPARLYCRQHARKIEGEQDGKEQ